jgi:glutathione S-transferase
VSEGLRAKAARWLFRLEASLLRASARLRKAEDKSAARIGETQEAATAAVVEPHLTYTDEYASERVAWAKSLGELPPGQRRAYIGTEGDEVLPWIEKMGAASQLLGPRELEVADLSTFHVIYVGPRALEEREDVRRAWPRIGSYVKAGGAVLHILEYCPGGYVMNRLKPENFEPREAVQ